ncbi:MAG: GvpL/GvpF family gas vesicle protein [Bacteroidota bacterium]|nr:GvpL/GvpF family gas vesicle protein [Bacteroidota bacterium]
MKSRFKDKLAALLLAEMSERLRDREKIKQYLSEFTAFPPEKVTEEFLNEFENFLGSDKRGEIAKRLHQSLFQKIETPLTEISVAPPEETHEFLKLKIDIEPIQTEEIVVTASSIENEIVSQEQVQETSTIVQEIEISQPEEKIFGADEVEIESEIVQQEPVQEFASDEKEIMGQDEVFAPPTIIDEPTEIERPSVFFKKEKKTQIEIYPNDWLCLYGFTYAPNSEGKGFPSVELEVKGIGENGNIFGVDYGDVRFFMSKINIDKYVTIKTGSNILKPQEKMKLKLEYAYALNQMHTTEMLVTLNFWTLQQGREAVVRVVEDRYLDFLHSLIDVHDAIDWDVEVLVMDSEILKAVSATSQERTVSARLQPRESKIQRIDYKQQERVLFKEKEIAQKINLELTKIANKIKVDHIITLDSSFLEDWKPIFSARYIIGKDKRKAFHQAILEKQNEYKDFKVIINVSSPKVHFKF